MKKYVFFDFNGTILNDLDLCLELLNKILSKQNKPLVDEKQYKNIFTFPIKKYYELAGVDFSLNTFEELSHDFIVEYQPRSFKCDIYPNLLETVSKLKDNDCVVGILSASQIDNLREQLVELNIIDKFDFVLGLNDIYAKSKVDVARAYIKDNNLMNNELYFVGDTLHDEEVAKSIGAKCLLVANGHQSKEVLSNGSSPILNDVSEVLTYILD